MTKLATEVLAALTGKTLATAESCTGGGIAEALTAIAGSSAVVKGGIVSYCDEVKRDLLGVDGGLLKAVGAVSAPVAEAMAKGVLRVLKTDVAVSVTGLAGPGGDDFGNPVGTVFIGYADEDTTVVRHFCFSGDREAVRKQAVEAALRLILENNKIVTGREP